jgi:hypothetical protein
MSGDQLAALANADPGLSEALRQLRRGGGLRDGTGPDPLQNADVSPEVLEEFLTLAVREAPDDQVFGLAVTLPRLIHRRGAGQEALDVLLSERSLTPDQRDWVDIYLERSAQAARERGAQALVEVPPMDEQTRATTMQILRAVHAGEFDPGGGSDAAALFTQLVQLRTVAGGRVLRAAVHARVCDLVRTPATSAAGIHYLEAAVQVDYLYADELAMDMRRAGPQIAADQTMRFDDAITRLEALAARLGPSPM